MSTYNVKTQNKVVARRNAIFFGLNNLETELKENCEDETNIPNIHQRSLTKASEFQNL